MFKLFPILFSHRIRVLSPVFYVSVFSTAVLILTRVSYTLKSLLA